MKSGAVCFDTREDWLPGLRALDHNHGHLTPHLAVVPTSSVIAQCGRQVFDDVLNRRGYSLLGRPALSFHMARCSISKQP
jgi:hypothetical protein